MEDVSLKLSHQLQWKYTGCPTNASKNYEMCVHRTKAHSATLCSPDFLLQALLFHFQWIKFNLLNWTKNLPMSASWFSDVNWVDRLILPSLLPGAWGKVLQENSQNINFTHANAAVQSSPEKWTSHSHMYISSPELSSENSGRATALCALYRKQQWREGITLFPLHCPYFQDTALLCRVEGPYWHYFICSISNALQIIICIKLQCTIPLTIGKTLGSFGKSSVSIQETGLGDVKWYESTCTW